MSTVLEPDASTNLDLGFPILNCGSCGRISDADLCVDQLVPSGGAVEHRPVCLRCQNEHARGARMAAASALHSEHAEWVRMALDRSAPRCDRLVAQAHAHSLDRALQALVGLACPGGQARLVEDEPTLPSPRLRIVLPAIPEVRVVSVV